MSSSSERIDCRCRSASEIARRALSVRRRSRQRHRARRRAYARQRRVGRPRLRLLTVSATESTLRRGLDAGHADHTSGDCRISWLRCRAAGAAHLGVALCPRSANTSSTLSTCGAGCCRCSAGHSSCAACTRLRPREAHEHRRAVVAHHAGSPSMPMPARCCLAVAMSR